MKVKLLQEYNTPYQYISAGEIVERPTKQAKDMIAAGLAEPVKRGGGDAAD